MELPYAADESAVSALARIGRTEDIQMSPDNQRIAIAGAYTDTILVLSIDISAAQNGGTILLGDALELRCPEFKFPHGLFWLDNETIIVANRDARAPIIRVPDMKSLDRQIEVRAEAIIGDDLVDSIVTPGSVTAHKVFDDIYEVLICNNYAHYVTRHVLKSGAETRVLGSQILLQDGLDIPDGVAFSRNAGWIAISNHTKNCVHMYRNGGHLHRHLPPDGVLLGIGYPHGIRFSRDGQLLFAADAGAPFVFVYRSEDGNWAGERSPATVLRVVDDDVFQRGRDNPQEGGPKGIDICRNNIVLVASCEHQPIAFYRIDNVVDSLAPGTLDAKVADEHHPREEAKALFLRHLESMKHNSASMQAELADVHRTLGEHLEAHHALSHAHNDLSKAHHELSVAHHALSLAHHALSLAHHEMSAAQRVFGMAMSVISKVLGRRSAK